MDVGVSYYIAAIEAMESKFGNAHYYLFSDKPHEAEKKINLPRDRITIVNNNLGDENAYADLWLMSLCDHFIIANSTFSWWGAWLNNNSNKICIRPSNLKRLTTAIENGEWKITNQGIAFDEEGNLIDGQHRLAAILQTGKTVPILVGTNMDPRIFDCVDTGAARTAGDGIDILGSSHGKTIAAAIKTYYLYTKWPKRAWSSTVAPTSAQIVKIYDDRNCLLYTSPSPRDRTRSRMPSSA